MAAPPPEFGLLRESIHLPRIALIWIAVIGRVLRSWCPRSPDPRGCGREAIDELYFVALLIAAIAMLCNLYGPPPLIGSTR
jgi:hypothetical protein